jgi:hypothetical protein
VWTSGIAWACKLQWSALGQVRKISFRTSVLCSCSWFSPPPPTFVPDQVQLILQGWKGYGGNLYYFSYVKKSWHEAERFCVSQGAHLASVTSQEEQVRAAGMEWAGGHWCVVLVLWPPPSQWMQLRRPPLVGREQIFIESWKWKLGRQTLVCSVREEDAQGPEEVSRERGQSEVAPGDCSLMLEMRFSPPPLKFQTGFLSSHQS